MVSLPDLPREDLLKCLRAIYGTLEDFGSGSIGSFRFGTAIKEPPVLLIKNLGIEHVMVLVSSQTAHATYLCQGSEELHLCQPRRTKLPSCTSSLRGLDTSSSKEAITGEIAPRHQFNMIR